MFEKVASIIADQLGMDVSEIKAETRLIDDLKADSIDIVALIMDIESEFGVEVADEELAGLKSVQDILDYIEAHK